MSKLEQDTSTQAITSYLQRYPREITFDDDPAGVYDRYHDPAYTVTSDGLELGREQILQHAGSAQRRVTDVRVVVHDVVCCGSRFAARYTLEATMRRGSMVATEIHVLGETADDGRLLAARQLTRDVSPRD